jgi:hypothetical protein
MTDSRLDSQDALARSFGVELYRNKTLRKICSQSELEKTIFDVAQCSAATSLDLVTHHAKFEEEDLSSRVYQTLTTWKPLSVREIEKNVTVKGAVEQHRFSFVCYPANGGPVVGLKILGSEPALAAAERYAFLGFDLNQVNEFSLWKRLAILPDSERWGKRAKRLVGKFSDDVLEVRRGEEPYAMRVLPAIMNGLIDSAPGLH